MEKGQRSVYLDLLKCIAVFCVCAYHFSWLGGPAYGAAQPAGAWINRFFWGMNSVCVPLFVMVNGALLLNRRFDARRHAVQCVRLAVGVHIWYVITMAAAYAFKGGAAYAAQHLAGIVGSMPYLYAYGDTTVGHLWFVPMLIALYLLLPMIRAALDSGDRQIQKGFALAICALAALSFLTQDFDHIKALLPGLGGLDTSFTDAFSPARNRVYGAMIVYFALGGALHRMRERVERVPYAACAALFFAGAALLLAEYAVMSRALGAHYDVVYYGYNTTATLMMSTALFAAAAKLERRLAGGRASAAAALVGRNTLAVYYTHWLLGLTLLTCFAPPQGALVNLLKAGVLVAAGTALGEVMRRIPLLRTLV